MMDLHSLSYLECQFRYSMNKKVQVIISNWNGANPNETKSCLQLPIINNSQKLSIIKEHITCAYTSSKSQKTQEHLSFVQNKRAPNMCIIKSKINEHLTCAFTCPKEHLTCPNCIQVFKNKRAPIMCIYIIYNISKKKNFRLLLQCFYFSADVDPVVETLELGWMSWNLLRSQQHVEMELAPNLEVACPVTIHNHLEAA